MACLDLAWLVAVSDHAASEARGASKTKFKSQAGEPKPRAQAGRQVPSGSSGPVKFQAGRLGMPMIIRLRPLSGTAGSRQVKSRRERGKARAVESSQDTSREVKSSQVKSSQVKSSQVKPSQVKPSQVNSSEVKSSELKPSQVQSSQVKPSELKWPPASGWQIGRGRKHRSSATTSVPLYFLFLTSYCCHRCRLGGGGGTGRLRLHPFRARPTQPSPTQANPTQPNPVRSRPV